MFPLTDLFGWRMAVNFAATVICLCALSACSVGPRLGDDPFPHAPENSVTKVSGVEPRVAVAGMLQLDAYENDRHRRSYETQGGNLEGMLRSVAASVSQNGAVHAETLPKPLAIIVCPSAGSGPRESQDCAFPDQIEVEGSRDQLPSGTSLLLLVIGKVSKDQGGTEVNWSPGPYFIPMPGFSATTRYAFTVSARLYDMSTGSAVTEASAIDDGVEGLTAFATFPPFPLIVVPDEASYLKSVGRELGAEVGRRIAAGRAISSRHTPDRSASLHSPEGKGLIGEGSVPGSPPNKLPLFAAVVLRRAPVIASFSRDAARTCDASVTSVPRDQLSELGADLDRVPFLEIVRAAVQAHLPPRCAVEVVTAFSEVDQAKELAAIGARLNAPVHVVADIQVRFGQLVPTSCAFKLAAMAELRVQAADAPTRTRVLAQQRWSVQEQVPLLDWAKDHERARAELKRLLEELAAQVSTYYLEKVGCPPRQSALPTDG